MAGDLNRSVKIFIDNSDAKLKADELKAKVSTLNTELEKLAQTSGKDSNEYLKKKKAFDSATQSLNTYKLKVQETERILKNLSGATYGELLSVKKQIIKSLKDEARDTDKYREKLLLLKKTQEQINIADKERRTEAGAQGTMWSRTADGFNRYMGVAAAAIATITGISLTFRKLSEDVAHMDDVYSDVMKTTQMSKAEVIALNEEFKKMDTRTGREELNKIAEEGGRIGIAKENILEFTKAMDVANVALGDSFTGGVEEIANKLGKLKMLFGETKDMQVEKAYMSIGSAINDLGANGSASEANIAEFTTRVGSLPESLKPSIADTLALGAAFEESGIEAEVSSRAYNIFLKQASTESGKFAKVMGISRQEVEKLINENPMDFFLKFAEGMRGMNATDTAKTLEYLGINADGANKAIGAAANSTDRFRELIDLSNKSFTEGTSVLNEFGIKNNNLAAQLEKNKKEFTEQALALGEKLSPAMLGSVKASTLLIKSFSWILNNLPTVGKFIAILTGYYIAYNAQQVIANLRGREGIGLLIKKMALDSVYEVRAKSLIIQEEIRLALTGKQTIASKAAAIAQIFWNNTVKANPWGAAITVLTTIIGLIWLYASRTKEATAAQKSIIEINKSIKDQYGEQQAKIQALVSTLYNEKIALSQRKKALTDLQAIVPNYHASLTAEGKLINSNKVAIDEYLVSLQNEIKFKAIQSQLEKQYVDQYDAKTALEEKLRTLNNINKKSGRAQITFEAALKIDPNQVDVKKYLQATDAINKLKKEMEKSPIPKTIIPTGGDGGGNVPVVDGNADSIAKKHKEDIDKILKDNQILLDAEYQLHVKRLKAADLYGKDLKDLTESQLQERLALEKTYIDRVQTVSTEAENRRYNRALKDANLDVKDPSSLTGDDKKAYELLELQHQNNLLAITQKGENDRKSYTEQTEAVLMKIIQDLHQKTQDSISATADAERIAAKTKYERVLAENGDIVAAKEQYDKDIEAADQRALDSRLKENRAYLAQLEIQTGISEEDRKAQTKAVSDAIAKDEAAQLDDRIKKEEQFQERRKSVIENYIGTSIASQYQLELDAINKMYADKEALTDEKEAAIMGLKLKYAQEYINEAQGIITAGSNFVSALSDAETKQVAADHQKQLSSLNKKYEQGVISAEDYNKEKKKLDNEKAQAELDIQKKYADAQFAIQVAQIVASTAQGVANAWAASMTFGPAGPAIAAGLTALMVGTGAAQIAAANAERNRIKSMTLDADTSSSTDVASAGSSSTGERTVGQAASGRYDVIGEQDGKMYRNVPAVNTPLTGIVTNPTIISEQGNELIISAPDLARLQKHVNYPLLLSAINDARNNTVPQRANGNYVAISGASSPTGSASAGGGNVDIYQVMTQVLALLTYLKENGIDAHFYLTELEQKQAQAEKVKNLAKKGDA